MNNAGNSFTCSVGIDLGAKYTGLFYVSHLSNVTPTAKNCEAVTLVNGDQIKYSMTERTAVRHRIRSKKRFYLARRLLLLIVHEQLEQVHSDLSDTEKRKLQEALSSLLKRRGYSRVESEIDTGILEGLSGEVFSGIPGLDCFDEFNSIGESWHAISGQFDQVRAVLNSLPQDSDFKDHIKKNFPGHAQKDSLKNYCSGLKVLKEDAKAILNLSVMGHKHRTKYLEAIRGDIEKDTRLRPAIEAFGSADRFWRLVGNLSNLQLRAERWYFNDKRFETGDVLDESKLQAVLVRAFQYFHPDPENSQAHRQLIAELQSADNIIECLCELDPVRTIPPYEDQNNRRPPIDNTLFLNPQSLTRLYGNAWLTWSQRLELNSPEMAVGLDEIVKTTDRKSRIKVKENGNSVLPNQQYRSSYLLQRFLDRSKALDDFRLRLLAYGGRSNEAIKAREALTSVLGSQHVETFISFARRYYDEVARSKEGIWLGSADSLLESSGIHPKMKKQILHILVANVLQISSSQAQDFIDKIWRKKYKGRSTPCSSCKGIEEDRKSIGGEFNLRYTRAIYRQTEGLPEEKEDKLFLQIQKVVNEVALFIGTELGLDAETISKFQNPYSLAQLYTLIETERNGFSNSCLAVHLENAWRMQMVNSQPDADGVIKKSAHCSRLPADCVRPFDGVVRRVLDKQAWEVAQSIKQKVANQVNFKNGTVRVPFAVESNKFAFSASLYELKKLTVKQKESEKLVEKIKKQWQSKDLRIINASRGVCPYTGETLDKNGEIDHILPRSLSVKISGTIFDSEFNLIYVSQKGNQLKSNQIYGLQQLNKKYLSQIFGTDNVDAISQQIEDTVRALSDSRRLRYFDLLSTEEQDCVRHAMFLDSGSEARDLVINALGVRRQTLVNGTQSWFVRKIIEKTIDSLRAWTRKTGNKLDFHVIACDAQSVSGIRKSLSESADSKVFVKDEIQAVASHSIDAMCAFACAGRTLAGAALVNYDTVFGNESLPTVLENLYPGQCRVVRIDPISLDRKENLESTAMFKEGIYAEKFLPINVQDAKVYIGFDNQSNRVELIGKNPEQFLKTIELFLDKPVNSDLSVKTTYRIDKAKAFEFLSKVAHSKVSDKENALATALEGLRYTTVKKNIESVLVAKNKKSFVDSNEVLKIEKFTIKVNVKLDKFKAKGPLLLPAYSDWQKLLALPEISGVLGQEIKNFDLNACLRSYFIGSQNRSLSHAPTRRVFSLPMVENPSGGVRIQRNNFEGKSVWQIHSANSLFRGFQLKDDKVQWKRTELLQGLQSRTLTVSERRLVETDKFVPMSEWLLVRNESPLIWMAPGTADRFYIRVRLPFKDFQQWVVPADKDFKFTSGLDLRASLKAQEFSDLLSSDLKSVLGKPRSVLFLEKVGEEIQFRYIVESTNAEMRSLYAKAKEGNASSHD